MNNRRNIIIAVIVILLVAAGAVAWLMRGDRAAGPVAGPGPAGASSSTTAAPAPSDVQVPGVADAGLPDNVARPTAVTEAAPGVSAEFRAFTVSVEKGRFVPDTIILRQGDTANIRFTAVDRDYDFRQPDYGLGAPLRMGKAQTIEFAGTAAGKYTFYCESCGGPASGPVGYIVVAPND